MTTINYEKASLWSAGLYISLDVLPSPRIIFSKRVRVGYEFLTVAINAGTIWLTSRVF